MAAAQGTDIDCLVSSRLRVKRLARGFSQRELAEKANITIQQYRKYETGVNRISCGKIYIFANYLNVPVSYFFSQER